MNVLAIISDTLRRDRLNFYRDRPAAGAAATGPAARIDWPDRLAWTPNLDRLAARSTVFDRYYAAAFPTMPARADLLTGKWTFSYMTWGPLSLTEVTVSQILSEAGFTTVGVVDTPFYVSNGYGYDRGFQYFHDLGSQFRAPTLLRRARSSEYDYCAPQTFTLAEQALERIYDRPFFLWVDTWDPHEPWDPPLWYARRYKPDYDGKVVTPPYHDYRQAGLSESDLETARACYLGEITMVDRWVGRLLERLESLGIADTTAIIFLSDHGFYFGEHGGLFGKMIRGETWFTWIRSPLYEELAHVPLLISVPGVTPRRVPQLASAVDVLPTILDLAGVALPSGAAAHGRSLLPLVRGDSAPGREFVVTAMPLANPGEGVRVVDSGLREVLEFQPATVTTSEWSLLYSARGEAVELYHLPGDPHQERNVAGEHPDVVREIFQRYVGLLRELGTSPTYLEPRSAL